MELRLELKKKSCGTVLKQSCGKVLVLLCTHVRCCPPPTGLAHEQSLLGQAKLKDVLPGRKWIVLIGLDGCRARGGPAGLGHALPASATSIVGCNASRVRLSCCNSKPVLFVCIQVAGLLGGRLCRSVSHRAGCIHHHAV